MTAPVLDPDKLYCSDCKHCYVCTCVPFSAPLEYMGTSYACGL